MENEHVQKPDPFHSPFDGELMYCTVHHREVYVKGTRANGIDPFHWTSQTLGDDTNYEVCYGEFITLPPPYLSTEEWEQIFSMEESVYGTESIF